MKKIFILGTILLVLIGIVIFLTVYVPSPYFLRTLLNDLIPLAISGILFFVIISLLVPNPKVSGFKGLLIMELIEHIIFPILLLLIITNFPILFYPLMIITLVLVYGFLVGRIKTVIDIPKLGLLCFLIYLAVWVPSMLFYLSKLYNVSFYLLSIITCSIPVVIYLYFNRNNITTKLETISFLRK